MYGGCLDFAHNYTHFSGCYIGKNYSECHYYYLFPSKQCNKKVEHGNHSVQIKETNEQMCQEQKGA